MNLTTPQENVARRASRSAVVTALSSLRRYFHYNRWLGSTNRYNRDTIKRIDSDIPASLLNSKHLSEYIGASAILHCADGWGFLARAVSSHIAGDGKQALHLAYYSELRAAMALLATEGFGIFNNKHFALASDGICHLFPSNIGGTHKVTWKLLEYWSETLDAASLLERVLSPGGRPLREWISAFPGSSSARVVGADFLRTWGVDIQQLAVDHIARNEASYRPGRLSTQVHLSAVGSAKFVVDLWEIFEPANHSRVANIDRFLLRSILEATYQSVHGRRRDRRAFTADLKRMLLGFGLSDQLSAEWISFLNRESHKEDPAIMISAKAAPRRETPEHHTQVMARAALLLRVASGACHELLRDAFITRAEMQFWWSSLGLDRGLWESSNEPRDFTDLWADIELALEDMRNWIDDSAAKRSRQELVVEHATGITMLSSCERVALWATLP